MSSSSSPARELIVYIGTYTKTSSKGIYLSRLDLETGRLGECTLAAEVANPSFLAASPDHRHIYAVSEQTGAQFRGKPSGTVGAYSADPVTGVLAFINQAASGGRGPAYVSVGPDNKNIFVANYGSGSVAVLPVGAKGGLGDPACVMQHEGMSIHPTRQRQPYAHSINVSADGRFAFAADLGNDKLQIYRVDSAAGTLTAADPAAAVLTPGSGPRHFALSPDQKYAYLVNELANTITVFSFDSEAGKLQEIQTASTLPIVFFDKNTAAEIAVHPSGRFVYASNRGHDSLAVFRVESPSGLLSLVQHIPSGGKTPRHFAIDPTGRWLIAANQDGNSLIVFAIDAQTGRLTLTGQTVTLAMPVCVRFL